MLKRLYRVLLAAGLCRSPSRNSTATALVPAAFRRGDNIPWAPAPSPTARGAGMHFYTARDRKDDPHSAFALLKAKATGHLRAHFHMEARIAASTHVNMYWQHVLSNMPDGEFMYMGRKHELHPDGCEYEILWFGTEIVLVAYHRALDRIDNHPDHVRRTYVTQLNLPHPLYTHKHTVELTAEVASRLAIWEEAGV